MKKKFTFLMAALMLLAIIGLPGKAVGQTRSTYTISLLDNGSDSDGSSNIGYKTHNYVSTYVSITDNLDYVNTISTGGTFQASSGNGWKLSSRSTTGNFTLGLTSSAQELTVSKVTINAKNYGSDATTLTVTVTSVSGTAQSKTFSNLASSFTDYEFTLTTASTIQSIQVQANGNNKRAYVHHITVTYGAATYDVTYKANGGTGNDLVDNNGGAGYSNGGTVTVKANEGTGNPNFSRTGYTFANWNTVAGGGGTSYSAGNTFSISSNTNLFAQWTKNNYNVAVSSIEDVTLTATYGVNTINEGNNANVPYETAVTLAAAGLGEGQTFVWGITKTDGGVDVTGEVLDGTTLTVPDYAVTIGGTIVSTYTVTYDCNGGTSGCPENVSGIVSGTSITLASAPTKTGNAFTGWSDGTNTYNASVSYTVTGNVTLTAQWALGGSGEIKFGSANGSIAIDQANDSGNDDLNNTWSITTVLKSGSGTGFSQNSEYSQVGTGNRKASSITFTMTLPTPPTGSTYLITNLEAKFGGFSGDEGTITLKVGETPVGSGSLNGTTDVIVNNSQNTVGTTLTITVTNSNLRCKCYYIKYSYAQQILMPVIITFNGNGGTYNNASTYTQEVYSGIQATLNANQFVKENSGFTNWSTEEGGGGTTYADGANITVNANTNLYAQWATSYTASVANNIEGGTVKIVAGEEEVTTYQAIAGTEITLTQSADLGYRFSAWNVKDADNATIPVTNNKFTMPAKNVTISATFVEAVSYELVTNINQLVSGKHYIIANGTNSSASAVTVQAMGAQSGNSRSKVDVSVSNNTITEDPLIAMYEFVINGPFTVNNASTYTIFDPENGTNGGYLHAASNSDNHLKTEASIDENNNCRWSIAITAGTYKATITAQGSYSRNRLLNNTSNNIFSCYSGTSTNVDNNVYLYVKHNDNALESYSETTLSTEVSCATYTFGNSSGKLTIANNGILNCSGAITDATTSNLIIEDGGQLIIPTGSTVAATFKKNMPADNNGKDDDITVTGWELISSPTNNGTDAGGSYENFASVTHLTDASYVLFKYDEKKRQWINSNHEGDEFTKLYVGQGYLYGNTTGKTVEFTGNVNSAESYTCSLTYNVKEGDNLAGFNLIGNPYSHELVWGTNVIRTGSVSNGYYKIVDDAFKTTLYKDPIAPMQGILVQAQAVSQSVTFYNEEISGDKGEKANADNIMFKVENSEYSDVAYALFDKGYGLNKISHRGENVPMLYIPQDGTNYAIAMMDDNTNSFNLNFEAKTTGRYTLSYKLDGEFNYLHVIDRATGEDINMLLEGSYSFIGSPMDNASRFIVRLGYLPNYEDNGENIFAYQSGNDIIVSGEGELQIFDVMGRKVSTMNIYGVETISGIAQGVYIFRMEGKTQKIVVR